MRVSVRRFFPVCFILCLDAEGMQCGSARGGTMVVESDEERPDRDAAATATATAALHQCQLLQNMIEISISSLQGLRTKCAATNDLTQHEIRTLEVKLMKYICKQLQCKLKVPETDRPQALNSYPRLGDWLRTINLRPELIQAVPVKLSLDALLQMPGIQVRETMRRLGSSAEECARLSAALSCLKSASESGEFNEDSGCWFSEPTRRDSGGLTPVDQLPLLGGPMRPHSPSPLARPPGTPSTPLGHYSHPRHILSAAEAHISHGYADSLTDPSPYYSSRPVRLHGHTSTPPITPPSKRRHRLKPPCTPPPPSRKVLHLLPNITLTRSKSHESQLGNRIEDTPTNKAKQNPVVEEEDEEEEEECEEEEDGEEEEEEELNGGSDGECEGDELDDLPSARGSQHWKGPIARKASQTSVYLQEWDIPFEQLDLGELIGKGRWGRVHRGRWHGEVAIRLLEIDGNNQDHLKLFKKEVMNYRQTRHENVVLFMGACMAPPHLAIITSFCKGRTLYSVVRDTKNTLDINKTRQIAQEIVKGMGYLHAKGIVHKDLKSKNVFHDTNKVVITDFGLFGISGVVQEGRRENELRLPHGWICYLAPEIVRKMSPGNNEDRLPFSNAADVYAFGTIWYELQARDWPITNQPVEATIWQVGSGEGIKKVLTEISLGKEVTEILSACWSYDSRDRPTFTQLADMLEKLPKLNRRLSHPGHFWKSAEYVS
uniref:non-specific serine/threonine protein kinase n=1 Tax=Astyanax mexicanus TaxID=7994 RepID=A0A8B9GTK3_ASTMX